MSMFIRLLAMVVFMVMYVIVFCIVWAAITLLMPIFLRAGDRFLCKAQMRGAARRHMRAAAKAAKVRKPQYVSNTYLAG